MKQDAIICLDIGGTNCRIGLVDRALFLHGQVHHATENLQGNDFALRLGRVLRRYREGNAEEFSVRAVSLGVPATVDQRRRTVLQASNVSGLDGCPICSILETELNVPVYLEKDVNLLLLYDLYDLKLPADGTVVGIYFGTGIGNSIYINGKLHAGRNGVSGELGHIPVLHAGTHCGCGNENCLETLGGGRRLREIAEMVFPDCPISELYLRHGDSKEIREQVEAMAAAVATEVNILDPEYVIIGGGVVQMEGFPRAYFEEKVHAYVRKPYPDVNLRLLYSRPRQDNGIIGAGIYGWDSFNRRFQDRTASGEADD